MGTFHNYAWEERGILTKERLIQLLVLVGQQYPKQPVLKILQN